MGGDHQHHLRPDGVHRDFHRSADFAVPELFGGAGRHLAERRLGPCGPWVLRDRREFRLAGRCGGGRARSAVRRPQRRSERSKLRFDRRHTTSRPAGAAAGHGSAGARHPGSDRPGAVGPRPESGAAAFVALCELVRAKSRLERGGDGLYGFGRLARATEFQEEPWAGVRQFRPHRRHREVGQVEVGQVDA
ncbi:hypothetical protein SBA3_880033 [Candidatus Sulfopaludibacter sp. SbA3]|nr:hypothetical protein SBA3_880033 [Candidatus Sulfopaludibacter sp. SbA3]